MLVAALDWWQFQPNSDILALEQADSEISWVDWLTVTKKFKSQPWGINQTASKLVLVCLQYCENLIPAESLLMSLERHPALFWLRSRIDFLQWQNFGITRFIDLIAHGKFASFDYLRNVVQGITPGQYDQIRVIVNDLLTRQHLRKDLTRFEKQLYSRGLFRKTLSKVYNLVVSNVEAADLSRHKWQIPTTGVARHTQVY